MNAPVSKTKYPPVPLVSLLTSSRSSTLTPHPFVCLVLSLCLYLSTLKAHHGLSHPVQDKFSLH